MKAYRHQITVLFLACLILGILWISDKAHTINGQSSLSDIAATNESTAAKSDSILSEDETYTTGDDWLPSIPSSAHLNVPFINQFPELPTGCEITSLSEALHFYGFDVDKEYLAAHYLKMKTARTTGCFMNYFLGSPWNENGSGCFAPAIAAAANSYLSDQDSNLSAEALNYASANYLFHEIAEGHPVIVWTTTDYSNKTVSYRKIPLDDGQIFSWPDNEHCVVLSGYDLNAGTVTTADPTYGIVEHPLDDFTYFYRKYFYQAVVIR